MSKASLVNGEDALGKVPEPDESGDGPAEDAEVDAVEALGALVAARVLRGH